MYISNENSYLSKQISKIIIQSSLFHYSIRRLHTTHCNQIFRIMIIMGNMKTQKQDKEVVNNNKKSLFNNTGMVDYVLRVKEKRTINCQAWIS